MEPREANRNSSFLTPKELIYTPENLNGLVIVNKPSEIDSNIASQAKELGMQLKDEFHISVIASKNGRSLKDGISTRPNKVELEAVVADEFRRRRWEYRLLPRYFLLEKTYSRGELTKSGYGEDIPEHTRSTVVQEVELPDLVQFYQAINGKCGLNLAVPLPHITLYSGASYEPLAQRGIGIYSEQDFQSYLKRPLSIVR